MGDSEKETQPELPLESLSNTALALDKAAERVAVAFERIAAAQETMAIEQKLWTECFQHWVGLYATRS